MPLPCRAAAPHAPALSVWALGRRPALRCAARTGCLAAALLLAACSGREDAAPAVAGAGTASAPAAGQQAQAAGPTPELPAAKPDAGTFPYFVAPEWLAVRSEGARNLDFSRFEVFTGAGFRSVEGRVFVQAYEAKGQEGGDVPWNDYKFVQSFKRHFEALGAQRLYEGVIPSETFAALGQARGQADYAFDYSSRGFPDKQMVFGMQRGGQEVYFIIASNQQAGTIAAVEAAPFQQTVERLPMAASR